MKKLLIALLLFIPSIAFSQDIATPVEQDNAQRLKVLICGSSTTQIQELQATAEGYLKTGIYGNNGINWHPIKTDSGGVVEMNINNDGENITKNNPLVTQIIGSSSTGYKEGQMTDEGYLKVYDYSGSGGGAGTTTSYEYVWDGTDWQRAKGDTSGYTYVIGTGNVTVNSLPNVTVGTGSVNVINRVDVNIQKVGDSQLPIPVLPANPYIGCSVARLKDTVGTTTTTIIAGTPGQNLYIIGIYYFNRAATAGNFDFTWSGGTDALCGAVSASVGAGFTGDTYLISPVGEGLRITTPAAFAITVFYRW